MCLTADCFFLQPASTIKNQLSGYHHHHLIEMQLAFFMIWMKKCTLDIKQQSLTHLTHDFLGKSMTTLTIGFLHSC